MKKIILVGAPRSGKSSYARRLRDQGIPTYCTDPKSLVKEPEEGVTYLPEGLGWSEASQYIVDNWFTKPGPWVIEGIATVRALRKVFKQNKQHLLKRTQIIRIPGQIRGKVTKAGQMSMAKSIDTMWRQLSRDLGKINQDLHEFNVRLMTV